jgi:hypothetical protein
MTRIWPLNLLRGFLALLMGMLFVGGSPVGAQEGTPLASPVAATAGHPAHIHEGTCDTLDPAPAYPLEDVRLPEDEGATPAPMGRMAQRHEVETSSTVVPVPLDDLLAAPHAINVHQSAEQIDVYMACGEIAGVVRPHLRISAPGALVIPLREQSDSGYAGMAWLQPNGDETIVTIFLAQGLMGRGPMGGRAVETPAP